MEWHSLEEGTGGKRGQALFSRPWKVSPYIHLASLIGQQVGHHYSGPGSRGSTGWGFGTLDVSQKKATYKTLPSLHYSGKRQQSLSTASLGFFLTLRLSH